jgi:hypothetical protein
MSPSPPHLDQGGAWALLHPHLRFQHGHTQWYLPDSFLSGPCVLPDLHTPYLHVLNS